MRILFDHSTPRKLRKYLLPHLVTTAAQVGWSRLENGLLLRAAEEGGFEVFVTADQNIYYQQSNVNRKIALVVLTSNYWPDVHAVRTEVRSVIEAAVPGSFVEVSVPRSGRTKK